MMFRLVDTRRAAELLRRHGAIAALAALVIVGFAVLAAIGATDRRRDETRARIAAAEATRVALDRDRHILDQLAAVARVSADEAAQRQLDLIPSLVPSARAAALYDPTGMLLLRSAGGINEAALADIGTEAAKLVAARPGAALLVTPPVRDGD